MYIIIALIFGIILSLAYPKANLHWLAWFALTPLFYYTYALPWKKAILSGFAFGIGFFAAIFYWIGIFGALPLVLLAIIQSLFIILFVVLARVFGDRSGIWGKLFIVPALWVIVEWIRSLGSTGLTWGFLGYSQYQVLPYIQISGITGVWGVSFLVALSNAFLVNLLIARKDAVSLKPVYSQGILLIVLLLANWTFGAISISKFSPKGEPVRAAVIQGNINQDTRQDYEYRDRVWRTYMRLTKQAADEGAEFVVWPEGVIPGNVGRDPIIQIRIARISTNNGVHILLGGNYEDTFGDTYNSAFLFSPDADVIIGKYAKVHLVPFGEYVPLRNYLPMLHRYRVTAYDTAPGHEFNLMQTDKFVVGTAICFESIFPYVSREFCRQQANILCVITNDAWFLQTAAAEQHMAKSVFRAIENNRYVLRSATTGISCIIDPKGQIFGKIGLFEEGILVQDIELLETKTIFTNFGNWFVYLCIVFVMLMAVIFKRTTIKSKQGKK